MFGLLAIGLVSGFGFFATVRWVPYFVRIRMATFDLVLAQADVRPGEEVRVRLEAQAARRHVWGAVGAGIGYSVGLMVSLPNSQIFDGAGSLLSLAGLWFGMAVGQSLSALFPVDPPRGQLRVTAMQPHGMTDYLHRREIVVEIGLAVLGWTSLVVAALAFTHGVDVPITDDTASILVVVGALLAVVATTTLLGQRRLLAAPLRAQDEDELVSADIVLAVGLRDLLAITISISIVAAGMTLFLPGRTWWLVTIFTAAAVLPLGTLLGVLKRPNLAPVAYRLSARNRTA